MGGTHNTAIRIAFVWAATSTVLLISIIAPQFMQGIADSIFSSISYLQPYPNFRLWLFDATFPVLAIIFSAWAVRGVHGHGYREGFIDGQG